MKEKYFSKQVIGALFLLLSQQLGAEETKNVFGLSLSIEDNQNLYQEQDYDKTHSTDLSIIPQYSQNNFGYSLHLAASQQTKQSKDITLANTTLSISRKPFESGLGSELKSAYGITFVFPTDSEQVKDSRFQGAFGLRGSFNKAITFLGLPLELNYGLSGTKNFHEYDLNANGRPLTEFTLKNRLGVDVSFSDKVSFGILFDYINGLTYQKSPREKFSANLEVGYQLAKNANISAGVATEGNVKKSNGDDSNISFFNENTSVIHTGLSLAF